MKLGDLVGVTYGEDVELKICGKKFDLEQIKSTEYIDLEILSIEISSDECRQYPTTYLDIQVKEK